MIRVPFCAFSVRMVVLVAFSSRPSPHENILCSVMVFFRSIGSEPGFPVPFIVDFPSFPGVLFPFFLCHVTVTVFLRSPSAGWHASSPLCCESAFTLLICCRRASFSPSPATKIFSVLFFYADREKKRDSAFLWLRHTPAARQRFSLF